MSGNTGMSGLLAEYRAFWREFRQAFHTTGALLPSGRALCRALASQVGNRELPSRILEVGPGTGAVTREIVRRMGPDDRLDLVEINAAFADFLRSRFDSDPVWQAVAPRVRVLEMPIQELPLDGQHQYECMVSGLPLNNFPCDEVERILNCLHFHAANGCTLSFFEYVAIRKFKAAVSRESERKRLQAVGQTLHALLNDWEFQRQCVWINVPPAWVHHLRFAAPLSTVPLIQPFPC